MLPDQGDEMRQIAHSLGLASEFDRERPRHGGAHQNGRGRTKMAGRPATPLPRRGATVATAAAGVATAAARAAAGAACYFLNWK